MKNFSKRQNLKDRQERKRLRVYNKINSELLEDLDGEEKTLASHG